MDWQNYLAEAIDRCLTRSRLQAVTFLSSWSTYSKPVVVECTDGREWVLKGLRNDNLGMGRSLFTEQVVAHLGRLLGAPIPETAIVDVPEILTRSPEMAHMVPGACHGSLRILGCTDRMGIANVNEDNRPRFAALSVLYCWTQSSDDQFIYENAPPHLAYSVDHGHFFPGGPSWSFETLAACGEAASVDVFNPCGLQLTNYEDAINRLQAIDWRQIGDAVSAAPSEWGVIMPEREAVADFLYRRIPKVASVFSEVVGP